MISLKALGQKMVLEVKEGDGYPTTALLCHWRILSVMSFRDTPRILATPKTSVSKLTENQTSQPATVNA